jgi:hypothetical protein
VGLDIYARLFVGLPYSHPPVEKKLEEYYNDFVSKGLVSDEDYPEPEDWVHDELPGMKLTSRWHNEADQFIGFEIASTPSFGYAILSKAALKQVSTKLREFNELMGLTPAIYLIADMSA